MIIKEMSSIELQKLYTNEPDTVFLLDVREPHEWKEFNIGGTLIPMQEIVGKVNQIPKDKTIVVICRSGARSASVTEYLQTQHQFPSVINLAGGLLGWRKDMGV